MRDRYGDKVFDSHTLVPPYLSTIYLPCEINNVMPISLKYVYGNTLVLYNLKMGIDIIVT